MTPQKAPHPVRSGLYSRAFLGPAPTATPGPASAATPQWSGAMCGLARAASADPVAVLRGRFPGLVFWFGTRTRSWWAVVRVPAGWRLVEAVDADELTHAVLTAATWPYPPSGRPVRLTPCR